MLRSSEEEVKKALAAARGKPEQFAIWTHSSVGKIAEARRREGRKPLLVGWMLALLCVAVAGLVVAHVPVMRRNVLPGLEEDTSWYVSNLLSLVCLVLFVVSFVDFFSGAVKEDNRHLLGGVVEEALEDADKVLKAAVAAAAAKPTQATPPSKTPPKLQSALRQGSLLSPVTPPSLRSPLYSGGIMDENQLEQFLLSSPSGAAFQDFSTVNASLTRPMTPYQTAYRTAAGAEDIGFKESEAAKLLLQRLQIEKTMHSEWPYRMRRWISEQLVGKCVATAEDLKNRQAAVDRVARVEYEKLRKLEQQQQQKQGSWGGNWGSTGWGTTAFGGKNETAWGDFSGNAGAEQKMRADAQQRAELIVHRRHNQLQRYLDVTQDGSCKDYVLDRLKQLLEGGTLSAYEWNGGGKYKGKPWTPDSFPTDSHILLHLFCTKLNMLLVAQAKESGMMIQDRDSPFSSRYLIITPQQPDSKNKDVLLWLQRRNPLHVKVVVRGEIWEVVPGSYNLFHALCLYVYAVAKEEKGVIEMMSLYQTLPDLLRIVTVGNRGLGLGF